MRSFTTAAASCGGSPCVVLARAQLCTKRKRANERECSIAVACKRCTQMLQRHQQQHCRPQRRRPTPQSSTHSFALAAAAAQGFPWIFLRDFRASLELLSTSMAGLMRMHRVDALRTLGIREDMASVSLRDGLESPARRDGLQSSARRSSDRSPPRPRSGWVLTCECGHVISRSHPAGTRYQAGIP